MESQQLLWVPTLNRWVEQTISTLTPGNPQVSSTLPITIYRQGTVAPVAPVYGSFAAAVDAINAAGVPGTLYVDGAHGQPVAPSGSYNLALITLSEFPGQLNVSLNVSDGATFSFGPTAIENGLSLYSFSNSPVITQPNVLITMTGGSWLQTVGSGSFIKVPAGGTTQLLLDQESYLAGSEAGSTAPIVYATSGSTFTGINLGEWSDIGTGALSGSGAIEVNLVATSATCEPQLSASNFTLFNANVPAPAGSYACFFALMPGDNAATVGVGTSVQFPQNGPTNGGIVRTGTSTFNLPLVGNYEVSFQVSVAEPGQLQLALNGTGLPATVVGRATGTSQLICSTFITTTVPNSVLSVINPVGNSTALTITPVAGGASSVSATLTVKHL